MLIFQAVICRFAVSIGKIDLMVTKMLSENFAANVDRVIGAHLTISQMKSWLTLYQYLCAAKKMSLPPIIRHVHITSIDVSESLCWGWPSMTSLKQASTPQPCGRYAYSIYIHMWIQLHLHSRFWTATCTHLTQLLMICQFDIPIDFVQRDQLFHELSYPRAYKLCPAAIRVAS